MIDYSKIPSPCYVLDEIAFRKNLELIKSVKDRAGVEIILAFKAFAMWSAFPIVREYIPYSTASSLAEARLAFEEMGSPAHTYGPAYTDREFPEIVKCSSHITFNSLSQFERLYPQTQFYNASCGLRINPEFSDVETYYIDNGHYPTQTNAKGLIEELKQSGYITENFPIDTSEITYYSQNNGQSYVLNPM
jgi:carboxynorspermidine decarboxylase